MLVVGRDGSLVVEKCKVGPLDGYARRMAAMERLRIIECCRIRNQFFARLRDAPNEYPK